MASKGGWFLIVEFTVVIYIYCVLPIFSQLICNEPYQCVGKAINISTFSSINGYKAAFGPQTSLMIKTSSTSLHCAGAFTCQSAASITINGITTVLDCKGTRSCANTSIQISTTNMYCYAINSCSFSSISSSDITNLHCNGHQSCAYANISGVESINAASPYSLYQSIIDSQNTSDDLIIRLHSEFAAYGATLKCRSGDTCKIDCNYLNACYNLYIDCEGKCTINLASQDVIAPITDLTMFHPVSMTTLFIKNTDEICNTHPMALKFDSYVQQMGVDIIVHQSTEGPICCRGRGSCRNIDNITYLTPTTQSIICSGGFGCYNSMINANNATVFCESGDSCKVSQISSAFGIYCLGYISCKESVLTASPYIMCSGRSSCIDAMVYSAGVHLYIYIGGYEAGRGTKIHCNESDSCTVICAGTRACFNTTLICYGICTLQCDSESFCPKDWTSSPTPSPSSAPLYIQYPSSSPTSNTVNTPQPSPSPTYPPTAYATTEQLWSPTMHPLFSSLPPTLYPSLPPFTDATTSSTSSNTGTTVDVLSTMEVTGSTTDEDRNTKWEPSNNAITDDDSLQILPIVLGILILITVCVFVIGSRQIYRWKKQDERRSMHIQKDLHDCTSSSHDAVTNDPTTRSGAVITDGAALTSSISAKNAQIYHVTAGENNNHDMEAMDRRESSTFSMDKTKEGQMDPTTIPTTLGQ